MLSNRKDLEAQVAAELCPATQLERIFASEIAYATWELERVRANSANTAAESRLNSAYSRATRNWNRARKELQALQSARTARFTRLPKDLRSSVGAFPLADPARIPEMRGQSRAMVEAQIDLIESGGITKEAR